MGPRGMDYWEKSFSVKLNKIVEFGALKIANASLDRPYFQTATVNAYHTALKVTEMLKNSWCEKFEGMNLA